jgi:hypothetical protein
VLPVRYELNLRTYVMWKKVDRLCGLWAEFLAIERRCIVILVRYELNLYILNIGVSILLRVILTVNKILEDRIR